MKDKSKISVGTLVVADIDLDIANNVHYRFTGKVTDIQNGWLIVQDSFGRFWGCMDREVFVSCVN